MPAALVLYWTCNNFISLLVELIKSRSWIKEKYFAVNIKNLKPCPVWIVSFSLSSLVIYSIKLTSIAPYLKESIGLYYLFPLIFMILVIIKYLNIILKQNKSENKLSFHHGLFLMLGTFVPLFIYGKNNHEFIKDGLVLSFFISLIIPGLFLFFIFYFLSNKLKHSQFILSYISAALIFFSLPMINFY